MQIADRLMRHAASAFSFGPGYEVTPPGALVARDDVSGYYIDFREKTASAFAKNPTVQLPTTMAQLALGWWERHLHGDVTAADRFTAMVDLLRDSAIHEDGSALWLHWVADRKYGTAPPFTSALAQAQAASVFVRAFLLSRRDADAAFALSAIRPLLTRDRWGMVAETSNGPALEEVPSMPPSLILNGWIYALWGLRDVAVGLGDGAAADMFARSTACLGATLTQYDTGWWTRYSLYPHMVSDLAKPFYHRLHVWQTQIMYRLTGSPEFQLMAARWANYDTPTRRLAAIGQKVAFVASGYR